MTGSNARHALLLTAGLAVLVASTAACATVDAPQSEMMEAKYTPKQGATIPIPFTYETHSMQHSSGEMVTTLGKGGAHLRGPFTRAPAKLKGGLETEVWNGFGAPVWSSWSNDGSGDWIETGVAYGDFAEFYADKIVAYLQSEDGVKMRCQMRLNDPAQGVSMGGEGSCQVSNGGTVTVSW